MKNNKCLFDSIEVNMQDLKIYICIEDPKTRQDVSIKGNLEIFRAFLSSVGVRDIQEEPAIALPVESPTPKKESEPVSPL